ncbi:MAG TPA: ribonucleotide-diphosphate reductase subunit beta [Solirubrobacteraceae bacterium]|jgi:ribonucleoside-diphosphate reductase beta chain
MAVTDTPLLGYRELYELWERQQWRVGDLDFTQDRIDWHERFPRERRVAERFGLSGFFLGEQRVTRELGPMLRAVPGEDARLFLSTQIADEARHVAFFDRFFAEVGVMRGDDLDERIGRLEANRGAGFAFWFDEALARRVDRLAAEPEDAVALVEAVTIYHLLIEGTIAVAAQYFILARLEAEGTLPGFVAGFTNVTRDEHRHVAFGVRFLRDAVVAGHGAAVRRAVGELEPHLDGVMLPPSASGWEDDADLLGATVGERRALARRELDRRLAVIGA